MGSFAYSTRQLSAEDAAAELTEAVEADETERTAAESAAILALSSKLKETLVPLGDALTNQDDTSRYPAFAVDLFGETSDERIVVNINIHAGLVVPPED